MADDASRLFYFPGTSFLAHMYAAYPQFLSFWKISPLPPQMLSCVISILCSKLCKGALIKMQGSRSCVRSGHNYAPPFRSNLISKIHTFPRSRYFGYMDTDSVMPTTPGNVTKDLGKSWFLRHGCRLRRPTSWVASPTREVLPTPNLTPCLSTQSIRYQGPPH